MKIEEKNVAPSPKTATELPLAAPATFVAVKSGVKGGRFTHASPA